MILAPYISSSMISSFNECPKRWAASHFYNKKGSEDGFRFGTAFHEMIEKLEDSLSLRLLVNAAFDDEDERGMVYDAVVDLIEYDEQNEHKSLARELHFELPSIDGGPMVIGHVDQVLEVDEKTIMVRDFKTNRNIEPAVVWNSKIQPRVYNWAIRQLYPQYEKVLFQVVYPRYAHRVTWEMQPENERLIQYLTDVWCEMRDYLQRGSDLGDLSAGFPPVINAYCGWCAIRSECPLYQQIAQLRDVPLQDSEGPGNRYHRLGLVKKAIESHMSDAKRQVRAMMQPGDYQYQEGETLFQMSSQNRVSYDAEAVWPEFLNWLIKSGKAVEMSRLISFSSTGVAAFLKDSPELKPAFEAAKQVKKTEESLTVVRGK